MKINDLRLGLLAASDIVGFDDRERVGLEMRELAEALHTTKPAKTSDAVQRIKANWAKSSRRPAYPAQLRKALLGLQTVQTAFGASAAVADLSLVLGLFDGSPDQSASEFCREIAEGLVIPAKQYTPKKSSPAKAKLAPVSDSEIKELADKLVSTSDDHSKFDQLLSELATEKRMTKPIVFQVAKCFLGYEMKFKTKDAAIEAIRRRQLQDAIQGARAREVQKIAV